MINYWNYLKLEKLLSLQTGIDDQEELLLDDEVHFILVHQVSELWFKLILRELRLARDRLTLRDRSEQDVRFVIESMARASDVLVIASDHLNLLSRLSTQQFLELRDKLSPASGFQSFQFAEIEIVMGFEEALLVAGRTPRTLRHIQTASEQSDYGRSVWNRIESARCEVTLRKAIADWFYRWRDREAAPPSKFQKRNSTSLSNYASGHLDAPDVGIRELRSTLPPTVALEPVHLLAASRRGETRWHCASPSPILPVLHRSLHNPVNPASRPTIQY